MKKEFSSFLVLDLFTAKKGTQKNMNSLEEGSTPLISAKKIDNGFKDFVKAETKEIFKGHCITLNNDGDGGAGLAFYQHADFALDTHVTALYPIEDLNRYHLLYIANCISKQRVLFGHGHSINSSRIAHLTCMLPIDEKGNPDYLYMEHYMKNLENKMLKRYQEYLLATKRNKLKDSDLVGGGKIEWREFKIEDVCTIVSGRDIYDRERIVGGNPYITATANNNGVGYFIGNSNDTLEGGCISVNRNGSVGYAFYHPYLALYGNDTRKLRPLNGNRHVCFFLSRAITAQKDKFGYGLKLGTERLKKQSIMLPSTVDGQPDYEYMESYMKSQETRIINRYIENRLNNL